MIIINTFFSLIDRFSALQTFFHNQLYISKLVVTLKILNSFQSTLLFDTKKFLKMASWDPDADLDILSSQTFNTPKYLFVFVINETDSYRMKKTFNINIEYLMNETYQLIDRLPLNGLTKKLINSSNLKCFLDELNGSETSDGSYDLATTSIEDYSSDLIRDKTIRKIFVLGSFDSDCFDILSKDNQLIISPLAIQYWIQMCSNNDIEFDIDEHLKYLQRPIFSECMKDTNVYFSKAISYTESIELYKRICLMNGTVTNKLDLNVTHAIIEPLLIENENGSQPGPQFKSSDTGINAASCLNVPVVNVDWINVAWRQLQLQYRFSSCKDYIASKLCHQLQKDCKPLLQQFTICIINSVVSLMIIVSIYIYILI